MRAGPGSQDRPNPSPGEPEWCCNSKSQGGHDRVKPRAKTLSERFGFMDEDLKKPKHDEIVLWLKANIESVVEGLCPKEWTEAETSLQEGFVKKARAIWQARRKDGHGLRPEEATRLRLLEADVTNWQVQARPDMEHECHKRLDEYLQSIALYWPDPGPVPMRPPCTIEARTSEYPVKDRTAVVGFVDFYAKIGRPSAYLDGANEGASPFAPSWRISYGRMTLLFEAKTETPSFGELMRQINHYRAYETQGQFYVISPDDRFKTALESENVGFVKYTG